MENNMENTVATEMIETTESKTMTSGQLIGACAASATAGAAAGIGLFVLGKRLIAKIKNRKPKNLEATTEPAEEIEEKTEE